MTLKDLLIKHEGEILHAYQDSAPEKFWTIGVGHLIDKRRGGGIPHEIAMLLLDMDIAKVTAHARQFAWFDTLDSVRQDVIINMIFNLGPNGLTGFKKMMVALELGDHQEAAAQMLDSKWAGQVKGRATELAEMMRTGEYPA